MEYIYQIHELGHAKNTTIFTWLSLMQDYEHSACSKFLHCATGTMLKNYRHINLFLQ